MNYRYYYFLPNVTYITGYVTSNVPATAQFLLDENIWRNLMFYKSFWLLVRTFPTAKLITVTCYKLHVKYYPYAMHHPYTLVLSKDYNM